VPDSPTPGIEAALRQRPEIRLLEESLRAARAGIALARTQDKPALSARAIAAHQTATAFTNPNYFAASLVLTWNLYDAGKARLDAREAGARAAQIEALLEEAKLGVRLEAEKAWRDMREAQARIVTADRQVKAAKAALEVSELRYQVRSATQIEVTGALLNVTRARANHTQALYDLHLSAADYTHATGADVATLR
jgi:outer membrane protein TolC